MNQINLYGTVGASFWDEDHFTAAQVREMLAGKSGPITVRINSGGGIATEGQAIYTMLRDYPGHVHVVVDAVAASASSLIAMAGDKITMRLGAWMLIHDPAQMFGYGRGTAEDHRELAGFLDKIGDGYAQVYADRAGIDREAAREIMRAETVYLGDEAVAAGFATHFEGDQPAAAAASFDYRIYDHAPRELRAASSRLGARRDKLAIVAAIAGVPRNDGEQNMLDDHKPAAPGASATPPGGGKPATPPTPLMTVNQVNTLHQMAAHARVSADVVTAAINENLSFEDAVIKMNAAWVDAGDSQTITMPGRPTSRVLLEERDTLRDRAVMALTARLNPQGATPAEREAAQGFKIADMAMHFCRASGLRPHNDAEAVRMAAHSTSDFPLVFENALYNDVARQIEQQLPALARASREDSRVDYRPARLISLSASGMPQEVNEGGEIKFVTMYEKGEARPMIRDFASGFSITNKALTDDATALNLFSNMSRKMTEGAVERLRLVLLAPLEANGGNGQTMSDGQPMFHSSHGNLAPSGGLLTIDTISDARLALRKMKGIKGELRPVEPWALVVPAELETAAQRVVAQIAAAKSDDVNPFSGTLQIIVEPGLSDDAAWYLIGNPARYDGLCHAFLDGQRTPRIESRSAWETLGMEFRLTWALDAKFVETSTWFRNPGA